MATYGELLTGGMELGDAIAEEAVVKTIYVDEDRVSYIVEFKDTERPNADFVEYVEAIGSLGVQAAGYFADDRDRSDFFLGVFKGLEQADGIIPRVPQSIYYDSTM